jgi:hypothetical protein
VFLADSDDDGEWYVRADLYDRLAKAADVLRREMERRDDDAWFAASTNDWSVLELLAAERDID